MNDGCSASTQEETNKNNLMEISNTVSQRLKSGTISEKRVAKYENFWINKLTALDETHTTRNGLTINEANRILNVLNEYVNIKTERGCPVDTKKVTDCLRENKGSSLACELEVSNFKKCVDRSLRYAVSTDTSDVRKNKKESYSETFERLYKS